MDTCVDGDIGSIIHDHDRPVDVYCYYPKDCSRSAKTVDTTVGYQGPQIGQRYILMINQAIHINDIESHLL